MQAQDFQRRSDVLEGWEVQVTSYLLGDTHHCHVDNVSPGATIARASAPTREEAERVALANARTRLAATRRHAL